MDESNWKFTDFKEYCEKCRYQDLKEDESPCDECLECGAQQYTRKPFRYEPKET